MQDQNILSELDYRPMLKGEANFKIGIIGAGRIAQQRQIPSYRWAGLTVAAVCDVKQEALDRAQADYGIERVYQDYHQLLEQQDIDIIDICTNTFPRKQITLDALAAGKHVLSEKPFARTLADALEMVETAERNGVHLAIHQPTRWYHPCSIARELTLKGLLGKIFYIELRMHGNQDTAYFEDPVTRWHADLTDHIFVEWGAHHFDLVRWFAGNETPSSVFAWGTRKGNEHFKSKMSVSATARFESGICASFSLNQASRFIHLPMTAMTYRIEGTEGTAVGDMLRGMSFASRLRGGIEASVDCSIPLSKREDPHNYLWNAPIRDGHLWPMVELINAISEGREALCSGRDNIETVKTYLAAMRSDEEYRPVRPEEIQP
ncbi:MAG: Gfo/Idh/MocA family oxidoreductase [Bacteroidota bacterium]